MMGQRGSRQVRISRRAAPAARSDHPGELPERGVEVGEVGQGERADGGVDAVVGQRQGSEVGLHPGAGSVRQHLGRDIEGDDLVPAFGEVGRVASGAAGDIGDAPDRKRIEHRPDRRYLGTEERVVLAVVGPRPDGVYA
jgi:hypothetical protein